MNNNKRRIKLENVNSSHLPRKITSVWMKISLISFCFRFLEGHLPATPRTLPIYSWEEAHRKYLLQSRPTQLQSPYRMVSRRVLLF